MWTKRAGCDLPDTLSQRSRGRGDAARFAHVCWATTLACGPFLLSPGASAAGSDPPTSHDLAIDFKLSCSRSFEQSQRLRNGSQYIAASDEAAKCANPKCGDALFEECSKIYDQLQTAMPSVVFAARDDSGAELTRVIVSIDGRASRDMLDGKPVRVDPGRHQFGFASDGYERTEQPALIRAGEQFRPIAAVLRRIPSQRPSDRPGGVSSREAVSDSESPRPVPLASYVLGAVSVVGLGAFIGFRVAGSNRFDELARDCKPSCAPSAVDNARQKYTISDVALGLAAAAAIAAVTVYVLSPREHRPLAALRLSPSEHALSAGISAQF